MNPRDSPPIRPAIIWISEKFLPFICFPVKFFWNKRSADLAETRNTNFFNSISNKFEKSKSGWLEEMGGPTGWQLATERVHKITRERGNESVDELCVSPARSQTFFSFQINWNRRWKNQNQKMFFKLFFPERREELALVVSKVGGNSKTHFVVGRLSSSPLISCRQIWNWKKENSFFFFFRRN